MKKLFFTSDHHFGHKNIIRFSERPFESLEEMNETLIQRWNEKVGPKDDVFHLGDVGLCSPAELKPILDRLNGNIFLVKGNHEKSAVACKDRFTWVKDYYELKVDDPEAKGGRRLLILFHYAMRTWRSSHHGSFQLYGHSHGNLPDDPEARAIDVGVDCHDFYPISYEEVREIILQKNWEPPFAKGNR